MFEMNKNAAKRIGINKRCLIERCKESFSSIDNNPKQTFSIESKLIRQKGYYKRLEARKKISQTLLQSHKTVYAIKGTGLVNGKFEALISHTLMSALVSESVELKNINFSYQRLINDLVMKYKDIIQSNGYFARRENYGSL
jgi:hypothetical protein